MIKKYLNKETITYLIFGVLTTVINYAVFWIFLKIFGEKTSLIANAVAFVFAVVFAYVTNKLFVFESKSWELSVLKKELPSFLSARILSFLFEQAGLFVFSNLLHFDEKEIFNINGIMIVKVVLSFIVVAINYLLSKFIIFKKK